MKSIEARIKRLEEEAGRGEKIIRLAYSEDNANRIKAEVRAERGDDAHLIIVMCQPVGLAATEGAGGAWLKE